MVFAEHPLGNSNNLCGQIGGSPDLRDIWRVSNPSKENMPPQASPVVDRACRVDPTNSFLPEAEPSSPQTLKQNLPKVKCVLIGDGTIGKTSLVVSYTTNGYPTEYVPTAFDNYSVVVTVDNRPIRLQLCDTAGQDDFDQLRPLCYPHTDIFLVCFSVVSPTSFHNIRDKWIPEIRKHSPRTPLVLVGTQCDLRNDVKVLIELNNYRDKPITDDQARRLADDIGAQTYIECSALTQKNLKEVFDEAILVALDSRHLLTQDRGSKKERKRSKKYKCSSDSKQFAHAQESVSHHRDNTAKKGLRKLCCFL